MLKDALKVAAGVVLGMVIIGYLPAAVKAPLRLP